MLEERWNGREVVAERADVAVLRKLEVLRNEGFARMRGRDLPLSKAKLGSLAGLRSFDIQSNST